MQYPGLLGSGALGDALTPGTQAGSIAASAHGGAYSHVSVAGGAWGGRRGPPPPPQRGGAGVARRQPYGKNFLDIQLLSKAPI